MSGDAFTKFTHALCEFFDSVSDMPLRVPLEFTIEVEKVKSGSYELKNPQLKEKKGSIIHGYH